MRPLLQLNRMLNSLSVEKNGHPLSEGGIRYQRGASVIRGGIRYQKGYPLSEGVSVITEAHPLLEGGIPFRGRHPLFDNAPSAKNGYLLSEHHTWTKNGVYHWHQKNIGTAWGDSSFTGSESLFSAIRHDPPHFFVDSPEPCLETE